MLRPILTGFVLAVLGSLVLGCDSKDPGAQATNDSGQKTDKAPTVSKGDIAVVETNLGTIKFELSDDKAPKHVANFEKLANSKFYDGTKFHRVIPGFMIQGGDPLSKGADRSKMGGGGPGWTVDAEFNDTSFDRGIVGMARSADPNSAGSQFFIMVGQKTDLNNQYTAFGKVTEGMEVADKIVALPRDSKDNPNEGNPAIIKSVTIVHPATK